MLFRGGGLGGVLELHGGGGGGLMHHAGPSSSLLGNTLKGTTVKELRRWFHCCFQAAATRAHCNIHVVWSGYIHCGGLSLSSGITTLSAAAAARVAAALTSLRTHVGWLHSARLDRTESFIWWCEWGDETSRVSEAESRNKKVAFSIDHQLFNQL